MSQRVMDVDQEEESKPLGVAGKDRKERTIDNELIFVKISF